MPKSVSFIKHLLILKSVDGSGNTATYPGVKYVIVAAANTITIVMVKCNGQE